MHRFILVALAALAVAASVAVADGTTPSHDPSALAAAPPPPYVGLRLDRTWTAQDAAKTFGSPTNFANTPIPANVKLDARTINIGTSTAPNNVPVNPATPNELQRQATTYGTYLNRASFTAPITIVPADQPLVPVKCIYGATPCVSQVRQMALGTSTTGADLHGGIPIPDDYQPAPTSDTDAEAVFYQPDYVSPAGYRGRYYECWKLRLNSAFDASQPVSPSNPRWTCASAGRVVGISTNPGHYRNWTSSGYRWTQPGDPDSTWQGVNMGADAAGTFLASDKVSREDCVLGHIDHAIGLILHQTKQGNVWPAVRNDGASLASSWPVQEGQRLYFPPDVAKPAFTSRLASMIFDAFQKYGLVVDDATNASVGIRIEPTPGYGYAPECTALMDGVAGYDVLKQMPWSKLKAIAVGSDAAPNPTG